MSEYRNTLVGIKGDGNAVGDNNRIVVNKKEEHHHHHRRNSGDGDDPPPLGIAVIAIMAIAASCYYFSRHAKEIYLVFEIAGWTGTITALIATVIFLNRADYEIAGKTTASMIIAFAIAMISSKASASYHPDILELAIRADSYKTFWCGLNPYGRQISMLHTLTACFVMAPAALLSLGPTVIPAFFSAVEIDVSPSFGLVVERLTSWKLIMVTAALVMLSGYAYSGAGWKMWSETIQNPPAWPLCTK